MLPPEVEIGTFENWVEWREKVLEFSRVEAASRPLMRKILAKLDKEDVDETEGRYFISVACPCSLTALYSFQCIVYFSWLALINLTL